MGDVYLSIVLGNKDSKNPQAAHGNTGDDSDRHRHHYSKSHTAVTTATSFEEGSRQLCEVCRLPVDNADNAGEVSSSRTHEASFAHQVCLPHSHAPSAIDRKRLGYRYLNSYGWDVDSRLGLGPQGHGIRAPVKAIAKNDTVGLGVGVKRDGTDATKTKTTTATKVVKTQKPKLNSKQMRERAAQEQKRDEKLRQKFYASEEMDKYLDPRHE